MNRFKRFSIFATLLVLLNACTLTNTNQRQLGQQEWQQQRQKLESVQHWTIAGKLAIITPQKKGSARLHWQQDGQNYRLNLTSLLGTRIMDMEKVGPLVTITDDQGRSYSGSDAESLVYRLTGWQMPLTNLPEWLKGLPKESNYQVNPQGQVTQIQEQNWSMHYTRYQDFNGWMMPADINFQGPKTKLHLLITDWELQTK